MAWFPRLRYPQLSNKEFIVLYLKHHGASRRGDIWNALIDWRGNRARVTRGHYAKYFITDDRWDDVGYASSWFSGRHFWYRVGRGVYDLTRVGLDMAKGLEEGDNDAEPASEEAR